MSKLKLTAKIGLVTTAVLMTVAVSGTRIGLANAPMLNEFFGQKDFEIVQGEDTDPEASVYYKSKYESLEPLINDGKKLVEEIEGEGAVLLKNENNALPLAKGDKVSLVGVTSYDSAYTGKGSGAASTNNVVTLSDGLKNAGFDVNPEVATFYKNNMDKYRRADNTLINDSPWTDLEGANMDDSIVEWGKTVIFSYTRTGGEASDMKKTGTDGDNGDYLALNANEISMLRGLTALKKAGKINKIVVLMNTANQIASKYLYSDPQIEIDAAMWIGTPGQTGFNAVGKLLSGDLNPSGHLTDMHWYNHADNPVNYNIGNNVYKNVDNFSVPTTGTTHFTDYVAYQEGIYVGYRYAETRYADVVNKAANVGSFDYNKVVAHPFGFGESYTDFEFSNYKVDKSDKDGENKYNISVDVKNVGNVAGKEVAEIYLQKPYTDFDKERKIEKAAVELVGFAKTKLLQPGEVQNLTISVDERQFTSYDATVDKTYILTEGDYYLTVANDAHDAINNILAAQGKTVADGMTADGNKNMAHKIALGYDKTTYATARKTKTTITNLFDDADLNKLDPDNTITYLTRSDWNKTFTKSPVSLTMSDKLEEVLLAQEGGDVVKKDNKPYPTYGSTATNYQLINLRRDMNGDLIPYDDPMWNQLLDQLTWDQTVSLLINGYRGTNALDSITKPGTLEHNGPTGLTQPYGTGNGLAKKNDDPLKDSKAPFYPCSGILTSTFNVELAAKFGEQLGEDALWAGYNGFYGIAINTHRSPYQGRAYEYLSEDPFLAGRIASAEVYKLQEKGCSAFIKHFALNEQETNRSGVQTWLNEQTFREIYLKPFEMAVVDGGAKNAMVAFPRIGATFAPGYKNLLTDFLRGELGMTGYTVTDMYDIEYQKTHMPQFVLAGCDLPDGTVDKSIFNKYKTGYGELAHAMRESVHRILYTTVHSNTMNGISDGTKIVKVTPRWMTTLYVADGVIAASLVGFASLAVVVVVKATKGKKDKKDQEL